MNIQELRGSIRMLVKNGAAVLPVGETLTTMGQRWSMAQCKEFLEQHGVIMIDESKTFELAQQSAAPDAGQLLARAVQMLAGGAKNALDADAVRAIVAPMIAEAQAAAPVVHFKISDLPTVDVGVTPYKFQNLLKVVSAGVNNVMLVGPSGSGKTHAAHQLAKVLGVSYYSQGACILPSDLLGFVDAGGKYHATDFVRAFENGGVCILDEIDSYSERAGLALNEALSNGSMLAGGRRIERHKDCVILAGANTWGLGATAEFTGRAKMDAALLGRFPAKIAWDYDKKMESALCGSETLASEVQAIREKAKAHGLKVQITPRHTIAAVRLVAAGFSKSDAFGMTIFAGLTDAQVQSLKV